MKTFRLSAVRLVGFHNYDDVLIRVRGDLFVVGENESGKTTLLDAIHLVLSGEQHLDWNSAASMTGPKRSGRTLQGIILRANLAGDASRSGGSICYAVVELVPADGNDNPTSLVFGASAMEMHTQVQRWAAIVPQPAESIPLCEPQQDGTHRILDRDEFEACLEQRVFKGNRGIGEYRTAVGNRFFGGREEFDEVTELWRTAKSYREITGTARNIGDVFRQVLPPPDPEPFQKIAKGFRDIAEIESELDELSRDVEALHNLRTSLDETREARETFRRYRYIRASWKLRDEQTRIQQLREERKKAATRVDELEEKNSNLDEQISQAKDRLINLRETDGYRLLTSLEGRESEHERCANRIEDILSKLNDSESRLSDLESKCNDSRQAAEGALVEVRNVASGVLSRTNNVSQVVANHVQHLLALLPESVEDVLDTNAISNTLASICESLDTSITELERKLHAKEEERQAADDEHSDLSDRLRRLEQFDDLVPELPALDSTLLCLREQNIQFTLLFQHMEWQPSVTPDIQAAVEAALGLSRLATIVVSPDQTETARQTVLEEGAGLRILDSTAVEVSQTPEENDGARLLDFLTISEPRVRAHLEATAGQIILRREFPPDGENAAWFAVDGTMGDRGARRRLKLSEPRWVGATRRRETRERERRDLEHAIRELNQVIAAIDDSLNQLRIAVEVLNEGRLSLEGLQLPGAIKQSMHVLRLLSDSVDEMATIVTERKEELARERRNQDAAAQLIAELRSQIKGTDAAEVKRQIETLEEQKSAWESRLIKQQAELNSTHDRLVETDDRIESRESEFAAAQNRLQESRLNLLAVLSTEQSEALDQYVFETKRGSRLKPDKLDGNIAKAREKEIELTTRISGADGVMNDKLAVRYGFRLDDDESTLVIRDRNDLELVEILEERREQERQMQESLNEKTRELFETIFARDLTERLRADLLQARRTLIEINRKLAPLVFGHSRFQLFARPVAEHKKLIELVEKQDVLNPANRDELRHYLEDRRDLLQVDGDVPPFLDYRFWFDYSFKLEHVESNSDMVLGSEDIVRGSVGAQTTHNYLLLLALASLLFDRCRARLRILLLDDAFHGLSLERKELLLRCAKQLGLNFAIATPDLDGTIQEHTGDSTTVLVEKDGRDSVNILPFEWERLEPQGDLFSDPRPEAIIGAKEIGT